MVLPSQGTFPAPRIEDIGVPLAGGNGPVDVALTIAAANLDLNATVTVAEIVGGTPTARRVRSTVSWGALPVDYLHIISPTRSATRCTTTPSCSPSSRAWDWVRRCR
jgi:hypothetical protein